MNKEADSTLVQHMDDRTEPLLIPNNKRFVLFPIQYHKIWMCYKHAEANFWSAEELEFSEDIDVWNRIAQSDRLSVSFLLGYLVSNNFVEQDRLLHLFSNEIQAPEARCFFGFQMMQGNIHQEFFNVLLDFLVKDADYINQVGATVQESPSVRARTEWISKTILTSSDPFALRLFSLATCLTIFNSSAFHLLLRLGNMPLPRSGSSRFSLPGIVHGLTRILTDYKNYIEFFTVLFSHVQGRVDPVVARERVAEAVEIEKRILADFVGSLGGSVSGFAGDVEKRVQEAGEVLCRSLVGEVGTETEGLRQKPVEQVVLQTGIAKDQGFSIDEDF
ncbi:Ribonucleotide-diphosphate reductase (RNR), small subunit [Dinochytrium kinnereticum]|nr:Ribonucleotide-diphosphate reductase (RNR), small subunit [Dinochytrium kinnereticum]